MEIPRKRSIVPDDISQITDSLPQKRLVANPKAAATFFNTQKNGKHIDIDSDASRIVIGRSSSCDIRITGADVSSRHCSLSATETNGNRYLHVTDLSTNGMLVNGARLEKNRPRLLQSGDRVAFAKTGGTYVFRYASQADPCQVTAPRATFFDRYVLGNQLGAGHYAVVREARDRFSGEAVAVKIFHPNRSSTGQAQANESAKLHQEMLLLLSINHPNIVKFISHYVEPINAHSITTYLVLEKVNSGELFQRIVTKVKLRQDETKSLFEQLLAGVRYLHDQNIIHRDIKPENILLDITPRTDPSSPQTGPWDPSELDIKVKIADFGLAKFIGELKFTNTLCGTPAYVAPEILTNERNYTTKVDLWLAGVLLYVCLCGFPPFSDELGPPNMREQILSGRYAFYSPYWDEISDLALDLISGLLVVDASERLDIMRTASHFWFDEKLSHESDAERPDARETINAALPKRPIVRGNTQPMTLLQKFGSDADRMSIIR